jgi:taurine--2-oxoglutarate transaminase
MSNKGWTERNPEKVSELCREYSFTNWRDQGGWQPRKVVTGGRGSYFWDADGNRYLDLSSQFMCVNAGHQHPKIIEAINEQTQRLCYVDPRFATYPRAELGRLLAEVTPEKISKFFLCLSGSEANENAVKLARMVTGKHKLITTYRSYHGGSLGTSTLTGESRRWVVEPGLPGVVHVPAPYCYRCDFGLNPESCEIRCAEHIGKVIEYEGAENVAAVIVEGVIGANGILYPHRNDYMKTLRRICDETGVLLIVDEVMSGFGRTGEWFAVDNWEVQPDIMTMAKGLTSSHVPMGAVGVSGEIAEYFSDKRLWLGGTYANHPVSCAAAIATIGVYKEDELIQNSKEQGKYLTGYLEQMKESHPSIGDVRGLGLFRFIELVKNRKTKENFSGNTRTIAPRGRLDELDKAFLERGINAMLHPLGIFIVPPLCISRDELDFALENIEEVLSQTTDQWLTD